MSSTETDDDCCECAEDCCEDWLPDCGCFGNFWCCGGRCWCVCSDSGVIFASLTWAVIGFVAFVTSTHAVAATEWMLLHRALYATVITLIYLSHGRAMWSDPGFVMDEAKAPDVSSAVSNLASIRWCRHCGIVKPDGAHHCSTCQRCVHAMDHHCSWVNNCVGERNLKHFLLFLFYIALGTTYSMALILNRWLFSRSIGGVPWHGRLRYSAPLGSVPDNRHITAPMRSPMVEIQCAVAFLLCCGFLLFVVAIGCDMHESLVTGTPLIDQMQGNYDPHGKRSLIAGLTEACGEKPSWRWPFPLAVPPRPHHDREEGGGSNSGEIDSATPAEEVSSSGVISSAIADQIVRRSAWAPRKKEQ